MTHNVDIIIVNWNVRDLLAACLRSIVAQGERIGDVVHVQRWDVGVIVVDNASSDDSVEMLADAFPWVMAIKSGANLGFSRGNNLGLKRSTARYALLLNPDTELTDGALATMLATMEARPQVGVVGPQLRYGDGTLQSSRRRLPTVMTALFESTLLGQWFPNNRWARAYHCADMPADQEQAVDWLVGACLLVRREAIDQVGLLDPRFFMYSEEMDWCKRIGEAGWEIVYQPSAVVTHHEGQSSGQVRAQREVYFGSSKAYYFGKHHGRLAGEFVRLALLADTLFKWCIEALKWTLGHKRNIRRGRTKAYGQVLRSGLRLPEPEEDPL